MYFQLGSMGLITQTTRIFLVFLYYFWCDFDLKFFDSAFFTFMESDSFLMKANEWKKKETENILSRTKGDE